MAEQFPQKRSSGSTSQEICILCGKEGEDCQQATARGLERAVEAANARRSFPDDHFKEGIERLGKIAGERSILDHNTLHWHRSCYSEFTHKVKIERLTEKFLNTSKRRKSAMKEQPPSTSAQAENAPRSNRRSMTPIDWTLCIFCQTKKPKVEPLISVTSFNVSNSILELSRLDNTMRVRLAGVNDLMAAEGKYHNKCRSAFNYRAQKNKLESEHTDVAMIFLCSELTYAAEQNQVLLLSDVWARYKTLAEETGSQIPQSFMSRRSSFKEKLIARLGALFKFVQPLERDKYEREPILVPYQYCHQVLAEKLYDSSVEDKDEMLTMPSFKQQEDDFLSMIHIALKIRRDVVDTEVTMSSAEKFVCLLYKSPEEILDLAREKMFGKVSQPEKLPPTSDAFHQHLLRCHYQSMVWRTAHLGKPTLPKPEETGWRIQDDVLVPVLMTLDPIPKACIEMVSCRCKTGCSTLRCRCRKSTVVCTELCGCTKTGDNRCINLL